MSWVPGPAWLFCPADRPERYPKALALADVVILDLEDAVAPDRKALARESMRGLVAFGGFDAEHTVVRVNGRSSADFDADVALVTELSIGRVMLAKTERGLDADTFGDAEVVALVETAAGLAMIDDVVAAANVVGAMWGAEDLVASLGGTSSRRADGTYRDIARYARSRTLVAAKAAGVLALDSVHLDIADTNGLRAECEDAMAVGFDATVAIHPTQIPVIRDAYLPSAESVDWATRLLAEVGETGVATLEGRMVDAPVFKQAQRILRLANRR